MGYSYAMSEEFLDEGVETGRVLSLEEFVDRLKNTPGIFSTQSTTPVRAIESVCLTSALITGALAISYSPIPSIVSDSDWFDPKMEHNINTSNIPTVIDRPPSLRHSSVIPTERKRIARSTVHGDNRESGRSGGSPKERIARKGIFAMVAQAQISGKDVAFSGITGQGGFANAIDATIQGVNGFKQGGGFSAGRRGISSIGFGTAYGTSGNGDGIGGVDDLIGSQDNSGLLQMKHRETSVSISVPLTSGTMIGSGRSKSSVMSVVMQNLAAIRYLYNNRLNQKPGLHGKVTIRFAVDEFGKVLYCDVIESTIGDNVLEKNMVQRIRMWRFDKIDKPGDVTEIVYPFVFSAG